MKKILTKQLKNSYLVVKITTDNGYFSATGEEWKSKKAKENGKEKYMFCCGCIHETILETFPQLKSIIDLHLSDIDGTPMYALENGFYYYRLYKGIEESKKAKEYYNVLKNHLMVDDLFLKLLIDKVDQQFSNEQKKLTFAREIDKLRGKWKTDAENAINLIELL